MSYFLKNHGNTVRSNASGLSKQARVGLILSCLGLLTLASSPASAFFAASNVNISSAGAGGFPQMLGWQFSIAQSLTVTSLGLFDENSDGLVNSHTVGIFADTGGAALMTAIVDANTNNLVSGFQFAPVIGGPITLTAGTYRIGADYPVSGDNYFFAASASFDPNITYLQGAGAFGSGTFQFPSTLTSSNSVKYLGPNFEFTAASVPEPATLGLFGLGGAGLFASRLKGRSPRRAQ
jgi:hypothetical protein